MESTVEKMGSNQCYETTIEKKASSPPQPPPRLKVTCLLITLTICSVLSTLMYGYTNGIMSGAMVYMRTDLDLDDLWQQLIVSVTLGVAALTAIGAGSLNTRYGRKPAILTSSLLFIAGSLVLAFAPNKTTLLIGRVIIGLGIGASVSTVSVYVAECAPPGHVRGRLLALCETAKTTGFFVAAFVAAVVASISSAAVKKHEAGDNDGAEDSLKWRIMLGLGALPAAIQLIGFSFMPESPRWLALKGREEDAYQAMLRISGGHGDPAAEQQARDELATIKNAQARMEKEKQQEGVAGNQSVILAIFRRAHLRKAAFIGCSLQTGQQFSGANAINFYAATIVIMSGVQDPSTALWLTVGLCGVKAMISFGGVYLVGRLGRRTLLLSSVFAVVIALCLVAGSFAIIAAQSPIASTSAIIPKNTGGERYSPCLNLGCDACSYKAECGFCYNNHWRRSGESTRTGGVDGSSCVPIGRKSRWAEYGPCARRDPTKTLPANDSADSDAEAAWNYGYCPAQLSWLPLVCLLIYFLAFNTGFQVVPQTMTAEIFPTWARGAGASIAVTVSYGFNLLISLTFLTTMRTLGRPGAFLLYAGITALLLLNYYFVIPETKNQSMENVQELLKNSGWLSRGKQNRKFSSISKKTTKEMERQVKQGKRDFYKPAGL